MKKEIMRKCPQCKQKISSKLTKCPNCGKSFIKEKILAITLLLLLTIIGITGCSGNGEEETPSVDANGWTTDNYFEFRTITESVSDEYVVNYKSEWGNEDWQFAKFDDNGKVMVTTEYTFDNLNTKQYVVCIFTVNMDDNGSVETYKKHFLSIGDKIFLNDGSCDEFFENIQEIKNSYS